ncbi:MAG: metallophosphoesterase [Steroidobacteraceae bacterium]
MALAGPGDGPPHFTVPAARGGAPLTFVVYGDTRFTEIPGAANPVARRALVARIASENPAAILIGGDLVFSGSSPDDYAVYHGETAAWGRQKIPVFPALGNHEFKGCDGASESEESPCLDNWWQAFAQLKLRPYRWYSVSIGPSILALVLDSDASLRPGSEQLTWLEREVTEANAEPGIEFLLVVLHYPPVRDAIFPRGKDEAQIERYLSRSARAGGLRPGVIVIGSHVHNYERYDRDGVTYLVSGGGGAKPVPVLRMSHELSKLRTRVNFHYLRFTLAAERLTGTMVRFDADANGGNPWSEPDRFETTYRPRASGASLAAPATRAAR